MKPSHFRTPRTLNEGSFTQGYGFHKPPPMDPEDSLVLWGSAIGFCAFLLIMVLY